MHYWATAAFLEFRFEHKPLRSSQADPKKPTEILPRYHVRPTNAPDRDAVLPSRRTRPELRLCDRFHSALAYTSQMHAASSWRRADAEIEERYSDTFETPKRADTSTPLVAAPA